MHKETTCRNCNNTFTGKYCNNCGQKVYHEHDKSVVHILDEGFHFITHFEGSFFNTLRAIFTRPGKLSLDYCNGIRKRYFKPLSFFLMLVILYLLYPKFEGLNMKLEYHARHSLYGDYAMNKAIQVMQDQQWSDAEIGRIFAQKAEKISKFLLFIIIPVMGFFSWLIGYRKRKLYFDHFVFSIEIASVFILWGFLLLPFLMFVANKAGWQPITSDDGILPAILSVFLFYLAIASRRFFRFNWWFLIFYTIIYTIVFVLFLEFIYKFILFFIVIHLMA